MAICIYTVPKVRTRLSSMERNPLLQTIIARNFPLQLLPWIERTITCHYQAHGKIPLHEEQFYASQGVYEQTRLKIPLYHEKNSAGKKGSTAIHFVTNEAITLYVRTGTDFFQFKNIKIIFIGFSVFCINYIQFRYH